MPHHVSTKSSREWQDSPVNGNQEEKKLRSELVVVQGNNTHQITIHDRHQSNIAHNEVEVERQLDTRQTQKTYNKRMGIPRSVQRLFTRLFHKKAESCKWKDEEDDRYCYKSVHPVKQEERYTHHSRGLSVHSFDHKVTKTVSERISHESLGTLIGRET